MASRCSIVLIAFLISGSLAKRFCSVSRYLITIERSSSILINRAFKFSKALRYCSSRFVSTPLPASSAFCCSLSCCFCATNSWLRSAATASCDSLKIRNSSSSALAALLNDESSSLRSFLFFNSYLLRASFSEFTCSTASLKECSRTSFSRAICSCSSISSLCLRFCRFCRLAGTCSSSTFNDVIFWRSGLTCTAYFLPSLAISSWRVTGNCVSWWLICRTCSSRLFFSNLYSSGVRCTEAILSRFNFTPNIPLATVSNWGSSPWAYRILSSSTTLPIVFSQPSAFSQSHL